MDTDDRTATRTPLVTGGPVPPAGPRSPLGRLSGRVSALRRTARRRSHTARHGAPLGDPTQLLALVPADPDPAVTRRTLDSLLVQTRRADRVVLVTDGSVPRTEAAARRLREVTVMRTQVDVDAAGSLVNAAWRRWQARFDLVVTLDADAVLAPDCLQRLEDEWSSSPGLGGVFSRDVTDPRLGASGPARAVLGIGSSAARLVALRQLQPESPLGGRVGLFDADALRTVTAANQTPGPWDTSSTHVLTRLAVDLAELGRRPVVSTSARAHIGPRLTLRRLLARR